jgi:hypothetical protein
VVAAQKLELRAEAEATFTFVFQWTLPVLDGAGHVIYDTDPETGIEKPRPGLPVNTVGWTAALLIARSFDEPVAVASWTTSAEIDNNDSGLFSLEATPAQVRATGGSGVYQYYLYPPLADKPRAYRLFEGKWRLSGGLSSAA